MSILDHFPGVPRLGQPEVLRELEASWDKADVFVLRLPVAYGKSFGAMTILRWVQKEQKQKGIWTVPTNLLLDQSLTLFPKLYTLRRKDTYSCMLYKGETCDRYHREDETKCTLCPYIQAIRKAHAVPYLIANTYTFLAHRLYRDVEIHDEAHLLIDIARDRAAKRLWHKDYKFPIGIATYGSLYKWVQEHPNRDKDKKLKLLWDDLEANKHGLLVEKAYEKLHNREELCLKLLPLDVSDKCGFLWPPKRCKKVVLMSATIGPQDIKDLGLDGRRVKYIDAISPIPSENRPCYYEPLTYVSYANMDMAIQDTAKYIIACLKDNSEKGIIHAPYNMAERLKNMLQSSKEDLSLLDRLVFHDQDNKTQQYNYFYSSPVEEGKVMVGSGMYEGLSLDGDVGRWQIICKIPYMSLADPAIKFKAEQDPKWYSWSAIKTIVQGYGRICRGPTDYGATIIIDRNWERLYSENQELFPKWFMEARQ